MVASVMLRGSVLLVLFALLACDSTPPTTRTPAEPEAAPEPDAAQEPDATAEPEVETTAEEEPAAGLVGAPDFDPEEDSDFESTGGGFGGRGQAVPVVRQASATVEGELDKDIIRRIVRAHINEVRACYNEGLKRDPALAGEITVEFTISSAGEVSEAKSPDTTPPFADPKMAKCVATAVKNWKFPKPTKGEVHVVYPFTVDPG